MLKYYKATSAFSESIYTKYCFPKEKKGEGNKLNAPKYFKHINLLVIMGKYVGNMTKDNLIELHIYLLSNRVIQGP